MLVLVLVLVWLVLVLLVLALLLLLLLLPASATASLVASLDTLASVVMVASAAVSSSAHSCRRFGC